MDTKGKRKPADNLPQREVTRALLFPCLLPFQENDLIGKQRLLKILRVQEKLKVFRSIIYKELDFKGQIVELDYLDW